MPRPKKTIEFQKGTGYKKYKAIIYEGDKKIKTVQFGDKRYEQYQDNACGYYSHLDHLDDDRRKAYRKRHRKIKTKSGEPAYKVKYSPAYFSYHYLW